MRGWLLLAWGLSACSTTTTVVRVADPRLVSLVDASSGKELIPAGSPPLTTSELAPGLTAIRGTEGQLAASCARCRVDDRRADGVWVFADGSTEALPDDAGAALELAAQLPQGQLRIPVSASRSLGRRRWVSASALLVTAASNVLEIRDEKRVDHLSPEGVTFQELAAVLVGTFAAVSFGSGAQSSGAERTTLYAFGALFSAAALSLFSTAVLDDHRQDSVTVVYPASQQQSLKRLAPSQ